MFSKTPSAILVMEGCLARVRGELHPTALFSIELGTMTS